MKNHVLREDISYNFMSKVLVGVLKRGQNKNYNGQGFRDITMDIKLKLSHNLCFKFCLWYFVLIFGKEWPLNNESAIVLSLPENTNSYMCLPALSRTLSFYTRICLKPPTRIVELHTISPTTTPPCSPLPLHTISNQKRVLFHITKYETNILALFD